MSHALCRPALARLSGVGGSRPRPSARLSCTLFSTFRSATREHRGAEHPATVARDEGYRVTTTTSQQRKVNDRPWLRESSNALPAATSQDPAAGQSLQTAPREYINATDDERQTWSKRTVEPLALLVHPQQPLSYLERLIQAEIPPVRAGGREKLPKVIFRAEAGPTEGEGKMDGTQDGNVAPYSGLGHEGPGNSEAQCVRWSSSTEVGDFIRDAARGREFAIAIEGHPRELRVAVPSFKDRTYYLRMRLRKMSRQIDSMSRVKKECDLLAHKGAYRLAKGGFAALASWWGTVYYVTFHTDMGWDLVEPVTYLAGLTTIMAGYLWFLFISRDLSYKAAMNVTVTRRQNALYQERGFDPQAWEQLVHEAKKVRHEIRMAATEYDVEWDELRDLGGEEVRDALEREGEEDQEGEEKNDKEKKREEQQQQADGDKNRDDGAAA